MRASKPERVDVEWLSSHIDDPDVRLVDVRSRTDYERGHVKGAVNVEITDIVRSARGFPAMCVKQPKFEALMSSKGIDNDACVIAYDNFGGLFSARFLWTLEHFGHERVKVFDGSIHRWVSSGHKLVKASPSVKETSYRAKHNDDNLATKEWVLAHLGDPRAGFLDVRKPGEYSGMVSFGKRGGHIPGAVHVHWVEAIDPDTGGFKPDVELRMMYERRGLTPDKEIATYCWMGMRASHGYMMLRLLGYPKVRMYDSSWSEWGDSDGCEVEVSR